MVIAPLDRKLLREIVRMRGQVITIALVIACGIASYVTLRSVYASLERSRDEYYARDRLGDVFASVRRAPLNVRDRLRAIDGVGAVDLRIVENVLLDLPDMIEPASARVVSVSPSDSLNRLHIRRGRAIEPGRSDEVLVSEAFANAHHFGPGDAIVAMLNGRRTRLTIVGVALSPEYVYVLPPGELMPDDRRFGVLWMDRTALETPFRMEDGCNDMVIGLAHGASIPRVLAEVDRVLEPYGNAGAYSRELQLSARFIAQELKQLSSYVAVVPAIFLGVAAFLVNVVLARTIATQREQLAALKAMGFTRLEIAVHYGKFVAVVAAIGSVPGIALGAWLGRGMMRLYADYFRFPTLDYRLGAEPIATALLVSLGASLVGAVIVILRAARLPAAEAMRPEAPPTFKPTLLERIGVHRLFSHAARMVLRDMERKPVRLGLSVLGIAFAAAIIVAGMFSFDAVDFLIDAQFHHAQRDDLTVSFTHPIERTARDEIASLPGVLETESLRVVPVRFRNAGVARESVIMGVDADATLRRVFDQHFRQVRLDSDGLVLSRSLADRLHLRPGDRVDIETLEDERRVLRIPLAGVIDDFLGQAGYMPTPALHRLLQEPDFVTSVALTIDPREEPALYARLKQMPNVLSVTRRASLMEFFRKQMAATLLIFTLALVVFASVIAVGVVYNSARIALAQRSRELASLRVLGFTRGEVAAVLIGEQMTQVLLAVPIGLVLGRFLGALIQRSVDPELFRFPLIIYPRTYAFATLVVLGAALASALLVRRQTDKLDLIGVLKARD